MKKLILVLVLISAIMLSGCLPSWIPGVSPDEPEGEPEVIVNAVLSSVEVEGLLVPAVVWSIENISESHIYDYSLTFTILYDEVLMPKTQWTEVVSGVNLYPTDVDFGELILPEVSGMEPETLITVLATY